MTEELTSDSRSEDEPRPLRLISVETVLNKVPLSRTVLLEMEGDGRFPRGRMMSGNRKAWIERDIDDWIEALPPSSVGKNKRR